MTKCSSRMSSVSRMSPLRVLVSSSKAKIHFSLEKGEVTADDAIPHGENTDDYNWAPHETPAGLPLDLNGDGTGDSWGTTNCTDHSNDGDDENGSSSGAEGTRSIFTPDLFLHYKHDAVDPHKTDFDPGITEDSKESTVSRDVWDASSTSDSFTNYILI